MKTLSLEEYAQQVRIGEAKLDGFEKGREEGREEGREKGREEGREEGKFEVASNLLKTGLSVEQVAHLTTLSVEKVSSI